MPIVIDVKKTLLYKRAKAEGESIGEAKLLATARRMLKDGVDIPLIHKYTGISVAKLQKLAASKK